MNLPNIVHNPHNGRPLSQQFPPSYPTQPVHFPTQSHRYSTPNPPVLPLSSQVDSSKCSLPSISTLLVYADGAQPNGSLERSHSLTSGRSIPPSPPIRSDYYDVGGNSPTLSTCSSGTLSGGGGPGHFYSSSAPPSNRNSFPPAQKPPYPPNDQGYVPYYAPPNGVSQAPTSSHPWTHHHHSSPASHAAFPQSQDRYICQTCNKAFSRPSSLRIHSHSHTGEKPFKCPHLGCGKAFSVRSNMKRHERGCHLD